MNCEDARLLIQPYLDDECADPLQIATLETHLAECSRCRSEVAAMKHLRATIRESEPVFEVPSSVWDAVDAIRAPKARWIWPWNYAGWAVAFALAASLFLRPSAPNAPSEWVDAHIRSLQAEHLLDVVSTDRHTVKPWFQGKLDFSPFVPDLKAYGYPLLGGRLEFLHAHPTAALVYGRGSHRINVFVQKAAKESSSRIEESSGYRVDQWISEGLLYTAVSDIDYTSLKTFSEKFRAAERP